MQLSSSSIEVAIAALEAYRGAKDHMEYLGVNQDGNQCHQWRFNEAHIATVNAAIAELRLQQADSAAVGVDFPDRVRQEGDTRITFSGEAHIVDGPITEKAPSYHSLPASEMVELRNASIRYFYRRVCERAEKNMELTGTVSGAHWNAMKQILQLMRIDVDDMPWDSAAASQAQEGDDVK